MQTNPNRILLLRLGQLSALGIMAALGLFDVSQGGLLNNGYEVVGLFRIGLAVATAVVWLPAHQPNSSSLPKSAFWLGAISLLMTAVVAISRPEQGLWGLAESFGMLGVLFVVARRGSPGWAIAAVISAGAAVSFLPLRGGQTPVYVIFGLIQALAAAAAIGLALYLRIQEGGRQRAVDTVRAEQRAEFARDLHDFIAHHVTGIVVQAQGAKFIAEQDPQRVLLALEQIEQAGAETMASMRRMVGVLRDPDSKPDAPLAPVAGVTDLGPLILDRLSK